MFSINALLFCSSFLSKSARNSKISDQQIHWNIVYCLLVEPNQIQNEEHDPIVNISLPELESLNNAKDLKILHQNIRGLFSKTDLIRDITHTFPNIHILGLTEFTTNDIPSNFLQLPGYTLLRRDRTTGIGGGVAIYI